jgi:transcriptional regulator with XRE-family HTH domain
MGKKEAADKLDFGLGIVLLRAMRRWSRPELSKRSGIDEGQLRSYEQGRRSPFQPNRQRLADAFDVEPSFLDELASACRSLCLAYEKARRGGSTAALPPAETARRLEDKVAGAVLGAMEPFLIELAKLDDQPEPRAEHRAWAEEQWTVLEALRADDQAEAVQGLLGDERSWALAVRLCPASCTAAAHGAAEALRLARLAATIAKAAPGPEKWLLLLQGFCDLFGANALRVGGKLGEAREVFARAATLWAQGEGGDPAGLLDANRRLDLAASFLQNDGRIEESIVLLDQALQEARSGEARARLLVKKANSQEIAGDYAAAIQTLRQAESLLTVESEPRLPCVIVFNTAVNYCHLDRYQEAEALLPRVEELGAALNTKLDAVRTLWLKGRAWAGLGHRDKAIAALEDVRGHFQSETIAYDYALVSLELAALHLEQGRARRVKEMAEEMAWIFKGENVHKEALAALRLFQEAARMEKARAEWTRRMVKYLYRAQGNPRLRFER